jgi:hypothetical protein
MCQGASAAEPGVPFYVDDDIIEQPVNLSMVTSQLDVAAVNYISQFSKTILSTEDQKKDNKMQGHREKKKNGYLRSEEGFNHDLLVVEENDDAIVKSLPPFFLYYATPHMHAPMAYAAKFKNASTSKTIYGDALREMDNSVGVVMQALEDAGLTESTLVIFTSDNGPWNIKGDWHLDGTDCVVNISVSGGVPGQGLAGNQGPFNGTWQKNVGGSTGKFTPWEGGHRVPTIFSWPGTLTTTSSRLRGLDNNVMMMMMMESQSGGWWKRDVVNGVDKGIVSDLLVSCVFRKNNNNNNNKIKKLVVVPFFLLCCLPL